MKGHALTVSIAPSRLLPAITTATHLLAGVAVLLADLPWPYRGALFAIIAAGLWLSFGHGGGVVLRCLPDGSLAVRAGADWQEARLLPDTLVLPWCAVLRIRRLDQPRTETRIVLPDSLRGDDFRRFRIWLKYRAAVAPAARKTLGDG